MVFDPDPIMGVNPNVEVDWCRLRLGLRSSASKCILKLSDWGTGRNTSPDLRLKKVRGHRGAASVCHRTIRRSDPSTL
jgi:hypothetical protein